MADKYERTCFCCGQKYKYCGHGCKDDNPNEPWRFLFHNENCKEVYDLWQSYRGKEISDDEYKNRLKSMNLKDILDSKTMVDEDIRKMLEPEKKVVKKQPKRLIDEINEHEAESKK